MLNTSIHGFHHPVNTRSAFDDSPEERRAFFEQMWSSPGFMKFTSNYADLLTDPEANAEWCDVHRRARSAASSTTRTRPRS